MIASFADQTVARLRASETTDRYGNTALDWSSPDSKTVTPVVVQPVAGAETFDVRGGKLISRWSLHAVADVDIQTGDRIEHDGVVYDLDGAVQVFPSASGQLDHIEVMLRRRDDA